MADEKNLAGLRDSRTGRGGRENFGARGAVSEEEDDLACRLAEAWLARRSGEDEDLVEPEPEDEPYEDEPYEDEPYEEEPVEALAAFLSEAQMCVHPREPGVGGAGELLDGRESRGPMEAWSFLPGGRGEREATGDAEAAHMMTIPAVVHGRPGGRDEGEPPPPAEVRRMLADRMRDMGRGLMISGMKPPRQQMVEIGRVLDGLLDQLERLADQPGREALRRRILLGLRGRTVGR